MRKINLFGVLFVSIILVVLSGCAGLNKTVKLEEYRADLDCIVYDGKMVWKDVEEAFGEPDRFPLPSGESLSKNTRVYEDKALIFHVEPKRIMVHGRTRYHEVVTKLEICTKK